MSKLSQGIERKFIEVYDASEWLIETDTGWESLIDIKQTIEYEQWDLVLENDMALSCADDHIVFLEDYQEIFVKDLIPGVKILTESGPISVKSITNTNQMEHMYDVGVDSDNHRFYSNGILSHNTTCAAAYLLWYAMFHSDKTILISAHKFTGAQEIMQRIRYGYELCPDSIRSGVTSYNKGSMDFENGSRIVSATTTATTGRGMSISLLFMDELAYVQPNIAEDFFVSISPTLATGGRSIVSSTPNSDEDMFATIWKESQIKHDEYGNEREDGTGINGYFGYMTTWEAHPERDEKWKAEEIAKIGIERFRREYNCIGGNSEVTLLFPDDTIKKLSIFELESFLGNQFNPDYLMNYLNLQVMTDTGWSDFDGLVLKGEKETITVHTEHSKIDVTPDHHFFIDNMHKIEAGRLSIGDNIITPDGADSVTHVVSRGHIQPVYDLFNVHNNNRFFVNNLLVKNCEFLTFEETLIDPSFLLEMSGSDPILKMGQVRWYRKPEPGNVYLVALDPSLGTGSNYSAIEVFEMPSMIQVAEWQHNVTPVTTQIKIFRDILKFIYKEIEEDNSAIYWSCENNTVGESALIVINDMGEETFPGTFLSEPIKKGTIKKYRKGFNTTYSNKISACSRLKYLIEERKMLINSKPMITELKSFVASGMSFKAKAGANDDLVSALLLVIRMSVILADWDPRVFNTISHSDNLKDEFVMPLPIFIG